MSRREGGKDVGASVRARLLQQAKQAGVPFQNLLNEFVMGRFLWRLSQSRFRSRYLLKGAQLFRLWSEVAHRPTQDLDLLGHGDPDEAMMRGNFMEVLAVESEPLDGIEWGEITMETIREEMEYGGTRVVLHAALAGARARVQVDVGFGDAVSPAAREEKWGGLIGFPAANLLVYPPETVVAEKLEAAVTLDLANSRMKDFFDLGWLSEHQVFDHAVLHAAVRATFSRRGTPWPEELPTALTDMFAEDFMKQQQWEAFRRKIGGDEGLEGVIGRLRAFLQPVLFSPENAAGLCWQPGRAKGKWVSAAE